LFLGGLVLAVGSACAFEPSDAVNEVGTEHTVTVTVLGGPLLDLLSGGYPEDPEVGAIMVDEFVRFRVLSGPNAGVQSNNDCIPACNEPDENYQISWTYRSNGVPGTDRIEVCVMPDWLDLELTDEGIQRLEQELDAIANSLSAPYNGEAVLIINSYLPQLIQIDFGADDAIDLINHLLDTDYNDFEDALCQSVEKTWLPVKEPRLDLRPPNIGAGLSGLFQGQPTPLPTASAPAPNSPSTSIRPPSTGDAALKVLTD
jgi:hypothetical protein